MLTSWLETLLGAIDHPARGSRRTTARARSHPQDETGLADSVPAAALAAKPWWLLAGILAYRTSDRAANRGKLADCARFLLVRDVLDGT